MELIAGIAAVVAPVFLISFAGFLWTKKGLIFDQTMVTQLIVQFSTPCLVFSTLTRMRLPPAEIGRMGLAALVCHALFLALGWAVLRARKLPTKVYLPSLVFPNVGNLGLPVCLFAFGDIGMALAMIYMTVSLIGQFTLGPAISLGRMDAKRLLTLPFVHALVVALAIDVLDIKVPAWIANTAMLAGSLCVPMMLMSLGVALGQLRVRHFGRAFALSALRVVAGGAIGWLVAVAFGMDGAHRGVLVIQSLMPAAVFNYLFARLDDNDPDEVAGVILISTGLTYVLLPGAVALVM